MAKGKHKHKRKPSIPNNSPDDSVKIPDSGFGLVPGGDSILLDNQTGQQNAISFRGTSGAQTQQQIIEPINGSSYMSSVTNRAAVKTWPTLAVLLRNIWFLRMLLVVVGMGASALLLGYSFLFVYAFSIYGITTSYFPWSWGIFLTDAISVQNLLFIGLAVSTLTYCVLIAVWFFYVAPNFRKSLGR